MELTKEQKKVVYEKKFGTKLIKGMKKTGKTIASVYRAIFLKNNYSLYNEDKILYLVSNEDEKYKIKEMIKEVEEKNVFRTISIFSLISSDIFIFSLEDLVYKLYYNFNEKQKFEILHDHVIRLKILKEVCSKLKNQYKNIKLLDDEKIEVLLKEIKWIKNFNINNLEDYMNISRMGSNAKKFSLRKNSTNRYIVFKVFQEYNKLIKKYGYLEYEDMLIDIIDKNEEKFVHIIVKSSEELSPLEIKFIDSIFIEKEYSDKLFIIDPENKVKNSILIKGKTLNLKPLGKIKRRYYFKNNFVKKKIFIQKEIDLMEHFQFIDLRHKQEFGFKRDYNDIRDVIVINDDREDEYEKDELKEVPVYNNIAAGTPIMLSTEQRGKFYLPRYWLKGVTESFILRVKGDSMIDVNINDGDYVLIRKQFIAENKDIVAVDIDGNTTLKRLCIGKQEIFLLPENSKYIPIKVNEDEGLSIIGIAVGVIKMV